MTRSKGFTLIELMVVIALLGIAATIAVPNFTQLINNNRSQSLTNELLALAQFARSTAVQQRRPISLCNETGRWTVKQACQESSEVLRSVDLPANAQVNSITKALTFRHNGTVSASTIITICHDNNASNGYTITVRNTGSARSWPRGKKDNDTPISCT